MIKKIKTSLEVDTQIVGLLSKSTYQRSFSSAIRELVSNAYDADSLSVYINIKGNYEQIEITDDGKGMTTSEFKKYLKIAGDKSKKETSRKYSRDRIGQFGIGFLSVFPFCEELEISTTSENSNELLSTLIPAKDYMETGKNQNVSDIPITLKINKADLKSHFTKIKLIKPTYLVKNYFSEIKTNTRNSIYAWKPFERFLWELKEDLPIDYKVKDDNEKFLEYDEPIGINVFVNNNQLFRNKLPEIPVIKYKGSINDIHFKFTFNTDYKSIKPFEARGVKIRVNNVGIGNRTDFGLKRDRGFSRLHWVAGEIHIDSKIKNYLNINRDEFISSPIVDDIFEFCASQLRKAANYIESVSVEEKKINKTSDETIRDSVDSKNKIIGSSLKKLQNKGFDIIEDNSRDRLVSIDKMNKEIYINKSINDIESQIEILKLLNKNYQIIYSEEFEDSSVPCFLSGNEIVINKKFPLFESKTYGAVFRKFILILLIHKDNNTISELSYNTIIEDLLKEFKKFI